MLHSSTSLWKVSYYLDGLDGVACLSSLDVCKFYRTDNAEKGGHTTSTWVSSMELPEGLEYTDYETPRKIIVDFISNYMKLAGAKGIILGLSGGIDSALVTTLAVEALGAKSVHVMLMPVKAELDLANIEDAQKLIEWLGISHELFELNEALEAFNPLNLDRVARGNVAARLRMTTLYARANQENWLVAGTGNKSELITGYFTKHGDGGCDLLPIADLYKVNVRGLSRHLGIPESIITKAPSAGLWDNQTDEGELGVMYDEIDSILYLRFDIGNSWEEVVRWGMPKDKVDRVRGLVSSSHHKRNPLPRPVIRKRNE